MLLNYIFVYKLISIKKNSRYRRIFSSVDNIYYVNGDVLRKVMLTEYMNRLKVLI